MTVRLKHRQELNHVAILVISLLGLVALIATAWSGWLIHEALVYEPPSPSGTIDAAVVALIGQMVSIATLTIGGLTAMLTSTGPKPAPPPTVPATSGAPESTPVTIVNPDPLPTAPEPQPTDPLPDAEPSADEPPDVSDAEVTTPAKRTRARR